MKYWGPTLPGSRGPFDQPFKGSAEDTWNKLTGKGSSDKKFPTNGNVYNRPSTGSSSSGSSGAGSSGGGSVSAPSYNPYAEM